MKLAGAEEQRPLDAVPWGGLLEKLPASLLLDPGGVHARLPMVLVDEQPSVTEHAAHARHGGEAAAPAADGLLGDEERRVAIAAADPGPAAVDGEHSRRPVALGALAEVLGVAERARACEDCGGAIPEARRRAVPGVRRCVPCQSEVDGQSARRALYNRRGNKDSQLK